jgi:hypothetical protein
MMPTAMTSSIAFWGALIRFNSGFGCPTKGSSFTHALPIGAGAQPAFLITDNPCGDKNQESSRPFVPKTLGRWKPAPWLRSGGVFLSPAVWRQCFVHDVKHFLKKLSYGTHVIGLRSDPDQRSDVD